MTIAIIILTVLVSLQAFRDPLIKGKLLFIPYFIKREKSYFRFLGHGLIHKDYNHLLLNMLVLFFFGYRGVEDYYQLFHGELGNIAFLGLYVSALIMSSLPTYFMKQNDRSYAALGASGAVSAIVFAFIFINPWADLYLMFIPIGIPGIVFGILYIGYSVYMSKQANDNIGHEAHLFGAIWGILYTLMLMPELWYNFIHQIQNPAW